MCSWSYKTLFPVNTKSIYTKDWENPALYLLCDDKYCNQYIIFCSCIEQHTNNSMHHQSWEKLLPGMRRSSSAWDGKHWDGKHWDGKHLWSNPMSVVNLPHLTMCITILNASSISISSKENGRNSPLSSVSAIKSEAP